MNLSVSVIPSVLTSPFLTGKVVLPGIKIEGVEAKSVDGNSRRMLNLEFDVAEMSFATFVKAKEEGIPLIGIPVFTGRRFPHPSIAVSNRSGIQSLHELTGKKVGLPQYWMTSSVWHRGFLQEEFSIRPESVQWFTSTQERLASLRFPPGVTVEKVDSDLKGLRVLLESGEIDALLSPRPIQPSESIRYCFADIAEAQKSYYASSQVIPIMHFVVMKEELEKRNPGLGAVLYNAFENIKQQVYASETTGIELESPIHGMSYQQWMQTIESDPYPYGVAENVKALDTFLRYAVEQKLVGRRFGIEELFAPSVLEKNV